MQTILSVLQLSVVQKSFSKLATFDKRFNCLKFNY